jgi:hypothetical protein
MTVRIGDRVRLLADAYEDCNRPEWGLTGDTGTVTMTDHTYGTVRVWLDRNGEEWWQEAGNIESLHYDDDALAMALELATLLAADSDDFFTFYRPEAEWLRTEVRNALLERAR